MYVNVTKMRHKIILQIVFFCIRIIIKQNLATVIAAG